MDDHVGMQQFLGTLEPSSDPDERKQHKTSGPSKPIWKGLERDNTHEQWDR